MGLIIWFIFVLFGFEFKVWYLFVIFVVIIIGFIFKFLLMGVIVIFVLVVIVLIGILLIEDILSGFGNKIIWFIVIVFFIFWGFIKIGLGVRILYVFV